MEDLKQKVNNEPFTLGGKGLSDSHRQFKQAQSSDMSVCPGGEVRIILPVTDRRAREGTFPRINGRHPGEHNVQVPPAPLFVRVCSFVL